ncbi:TetR/AcrR family transcriptional regulator [Roseibium alexandrii]|uniref:Transcriptional regulator n=1 Tax=Roseibium alexandrii (strain DSM 17067 / NCIMB 14079 / DFL-11) TaxID=244592 RepID=A0A5E8GT54_ROSAD|nr:TetR/AcrR family transcriptional regulator [Roseibium alexandrii]EEE42951.1 Transcriptional regulator [Roseibium alexandrii DFL-11]
MPYSAEHKDKTRKKIVETARVLFNRHGFNGVSIDMVMQEAGLTRGGFYNHFKNKEELFSEAVMSFLMGRGAEWREDAGVDVTNLRPEMAHQMIDAYLSPEHLNDLDGQCPMIALPSDIARGGIEAQQSFQTLLEAMVSLFETNMSYDDSTNRQWAQAIAALCVGGMVLSRALPDSTLAKEVRVAAGHSAKRLLSEGEC